MHFHFRNVNDAFHGLVQAFADPEWGETVTRDSRNGPVKMVEEPVIITYERPFERVLFSPGRDANPFFHLFESLWMLSGSNRVEQVAYYAKQMAEYSDNGVTLNGAYGYRWRQSRQVQDSMFFTIDQLSVLIDHLKAQPNSRRAVLQMWNVQDDLLKIGNIGPCKAEGTPCRDRMDYVCENCKASTDVCCNLSVLFSIRSEQLNDGKLTMRRSLDMTVTNRSNDLIWGCLGANYVHFSFLQEYVANCLGVVVGRYHHMTNNLHVYTETNSGFDANAWLAASTEETYPTAGYCRLVQEKTRFDEEVAAFIKLYNAVTDPIGWSEPFLRLVAAPMCNAFHAHKLRDYDNAFLWMGGVKPRDWHNAGVAWLHRRKAAWKSKQIKGAVGDNLQTSTDQA